MKCRTLSIVAAFALLTVVTSSAQAMYHTGMGRFMQRDPGPGGIGSTARVGSAGRMGAASRIGSAGAVTAGGGFIQRDPIRQYADGMNLYQYVRSDPVIGLDPSGTFTYPGPILTPGGPLGEDGYSIICGNIAYNPERQCCVNGIIYANSSPECRKGTNPDMTGFVVAGRKINEDAPGASGANALGILHTDVYYNGYQIRVGFAGAANAGDVTDFSDYRVWPLSQTSKGCLEYGDYKDTPCSSATDYNIINCIQNAPSGRGGVTVLENCQTDCEQAVRGCCLKGFIAVSRTITDLGEVMIRPPMWGRW